MNPKKPNNTFLTLKTNSIIVLAKYVLGHLLIFVLWWFIYTHLQQFFAFVTYSLLHATEGSNLGSTLEFFLCNIPKIFMLLGLIVYIVGILQSFITAEKTRKLLIGKNELIGNILAALLGVITPFCSCSAIPMFIGFVSAGIPMGIIFSFLISAPLVNEIALILLYSLLGWKVAALYLMAGLSIAVIAGFIIGKLHPEKYIVNLNKHTCLDTITNNKKTIIWADRILFAKKFAMNIFKHIWIYVVVGIAIGAIIRGYVPENFMTILMGTKTWWSVPLAVLLGIPLYFPHASGIIPIIEVLLSKGAALGTVLAFMMSVIAMSFPEIVILRRIIKPKLICIFLSMVSAGIIAIGYLFNSIL